MLKRTEPPRRPLHKTVFNNLPGPGSKACVRACTCECVRRRARARVLSIPAEPAPTPWKAARVLSPYRALALSSAPCPFSAAAASGMSIRDASCAAQLPQPTSCLSHLGSPRVAFGVERSQVLANQTPDFFGNTVASKTQSFPGLLASGQCHGHATSGSHQVQAPVLGLRTPRVTVTGVY